MGIARCLDGGGVVVALDDRRDGLFLHQYLPNVYPETDSDRR